MKTQDRHVLNLQVTKGHKNIRPYLKKTASTTKGGKRKIKSLTPWGRATRIRAA